MEQKQKQHYAYRNKKLGGGGGGIYICPCPPVHPSAFPSVHRLTKLCHVYFKK